MGRNRGVKGVVKMEVARLIRREGKKGPPNEKEIKPSYSKGGKTNHKLRRFRGGSGGAWALGEVKVLEYSKRSG